MKRTYWLLLGVMAVVLVLAAVVYWLFLRPESRFMAANIDLLYTLDGECHAISPDGMLLVTTRDVYELATGEVRIANGLNSQPFGYFSPDGRLVALFGDGTDAATGGVFETATGERWLNLPAGRFSADGTLLFAGYNGVFAVETGEQLLAIPADYTLSADQTLLIVEGDGLYSVATLQRLFGIPPGAARLVAENEQMFLVVEDDGIYRVPDGERVFELQGTFVLLTARADGELLVQLADDGIYLLSSGERLITTGAAWRATRFSADGRWVAVQNDGVYDLLSGEQQFALGAAEAFFAPDSSAVYARGEGVYAVPSGEQRFTVQGGAAAVGFAFNTAGTLLVVENDGVYDLATGQRRFAVGAMVDGSGTDFLAEDRWLLVGGDQLYDTATGEAELRVPGGWRLLDDRLVIAGVGIFDVRTLEMQVLLPAVDFEGAAGYILRIRNLVVNAEQSVLYVPLDSLYDMQTGARLLDVHDAVDVDIDASGDFFAVTYQPDAYTCAVYRRS